MTRNKNLLFSIFTLLGISANAQIELINSPVAVSLRGIEVVNDSVWWVSGRNNTVAKTENSGKSWKVFSVGDTSLKTDYRDIHALSNKEIIVMGITRPAVIYKTSDAGLTWRRTYIENDTAVFLDAIDFWSNGEGACLADPVAGKWKLLTTTDRGETWDWKSETPVALPGEAAFAAGGNAMRTFETDELIFVTGGTEKSHMHISADRGQTWKREELNVKGSPSAGLFAIEKLGNNEFVLVGGDFNDPNKSSDNLALTSAGSYFWRFPTGYRCTVRKINKEIVIATGDTGTDISYDQGSTWKRLSEEGFFSFDCAKKVCVFSGKAGKIGLMKIAPGQ